MSLPACHTLAALQALDRANRTARKLLIAPDVNWGRDILLTLARRTGGWLGWEVSTLRALAGELAFVALDRDGLRTGGDVELAALVDRALDEAVAAAEVGPRFAGLSGGLGFRAAVRDSLLEARTAGITPAQLAAVTQPGTPARDLAAVLRRYEALLERQSLADPAAVFARALAQFDREAPFVIGGAAGGLDGAGTLLVLAPDLRAAGLPGQLFRRLVGAGARVLPADPAHGLEMPERAGEAVAGACGAEPWPAAACPPSLLSWLGDPAAAEPLGAELDLFCAATPTLEVREALRRALAEGWRWDEVELAATDPDAYGIALDAVCRQLNLGYSALHGLPLGRTRVGRALDRWLSWVGDGLPADALREALEAGDLSDPSRGPAPTALARMLRSLEIGWGRDRYAAAAARLRAPSFADGLYRREDEDDQSYAARAAARRDTARRLADLIERLLALVPDVPERGSDRAVVTSLPALAGATLEYLELVPLHGAEGEPQTLERLRARLTALAALPDEPVRFTLALAQLRDALSDLRAWTALSDDRKPWSPAGGRPHLTDLAHAGLSGRPRTFVLGLDADRTGGSAVQDPILTDPVRRALESDGVPPAGVRRQERAWWTARAMARLRGTVTLSFAAAGDDGERATGPAHLLLQALRLVRRDASLTYDDLREALGAPACAVPDAPERALDARDVWLAAIGAEPLLLDGEGRVREAWPQLAAALRARDVKDGAELTAHHGLVPAAAGLDPRATGRPISPTALELLGRCPMAWFYKYGLRVRPPSDPEYDPERWLDAMERGSLLHSLYERTGAAFYGRQEDLAGDAARERVLAIADELLAEWRDAVPPPSEAVYESEAREIRESALAFLAAEREAARGARWHAFELDLADPAPTAITLPDGQTVRITGKVDRVDARTDGSLLVIDFKTGKPASYVQGKNDGPFKGGRLLQAMVYAAAVEARGLGSVHGFEYRFPTPRGENQVVAYGPAELAAGSGILPTLLDHIARGEFIATNDHADCGFCDYQAVCRAERGQYATTSPRAEWAATHGPGHEAYRPMIARRAPEEAQ